MTVSYTAEVATCKGFGCFLKLLFRWRGSIYKLVWPDLFLFLGTYFSLSILYRFALTIEQQIVFEKIVRYCEKYGNLIPVSFVLGFYVSIVVGRWWDQYKSIPWPDSIAVFVSANIQGQEEKARMMRRTIMRYCCLALTMSFTLISPRVKKRFPTLDHLIEAGLLQENEKEIIEDLNRSVPGYSKQWLPVIWASSIVTRARKEGKIRDEFAVKTILDELNGFRAGCGTLISYDWISVPLVYTQVVTLAVYSYFLACVMGRQWLRPERSEGGENQPAKHELDLIFPVFTVLQFFFYMGWLKVAESLVNPFGDDDDDFELNWMVDRNLQVSYLIVDEMHNNHPQLLRDQYWDEVFPTELPHTVASEMYREEPPCHSTANIHVSKDDGEIVSPPSVKSIFHMSDTGEPGRRVSVAASKRGSIVGRRERTASVRSTTSQSTLAESISGRLSHGGSVSSVFRRMFSRDKGEKADLASPVDGTPSTTTGWVGSTINVQRNVTDEVIPELDENMTTIISMKGQEKLPSVYDVFGPPASGGTSSTPSVDIPKNDTASAREMFFQHEQRRPKQLTLTSVSAPNDPIQRRFPSFDSGDTDEIPHDESDTASHLKTESDNVLETKDDKVPLDSIQVKNRKPSAETFSGSADHSGSSSIANTLAKTFSLKGKGTDSDQSGLRLLGNIEKTEEETESDDDCGEKVDQHEKHAHD